VTGKGCIPRPELGMQMNAESAEQIASPLLAFPESERRRAAIATVGKSSWAHPPAARPAQM